MKHRPEIDGLRAVAVAPVILFHAGFAPFRGGFVGVDVFFVISGYLISSIILEGLNSGAFSLLKFYEHRARRILPALFLVMLACIPFAWAWMFPPDFKSFSRSLIAVCLFGSNILFARGDGYFEPDAAKSPLLHTWSLAVEEQFYILFPLSLMLLWRYRRQSIPTAIMIAAGLSFIYCQILTTINPAAAFYSPLARAWEILAGSICALGPMGRGNQRNEILAVIGLALICGCVVVFDSRVPFPSYFALAPVVGACLILVNAVGGTRLASWLGSPIPAGVGAASYSAYLWHQPLFAFARARSFQEPSAALMFGLAVATIPLSYLSWKFVETPWRSRAAPLFSDSRRMTASFVLVAAGLILFGYFGQSTGGFPSRFNAKERALIAYERYDVGRLWRLDSCFLTDDKTSFASECAAMDGADAVMIWGDSHAAALYPGLKSLVGTVAQFTASGCPPLLGMTIWDRPDCVAINDFVLAKIAEIHPRTLVLHADWLRYDALDITRGLAATIAAVRARNPGLKIIVVGGVPQWRPSLPRVAVSAGAYLDQERSLPNPDIEAVARLDERIRRPDSLPGVAFVAPLTALCDHGTCKAITPFGGGFSLTAWDYGHLTAAGSDLVARAILRDR